MTYMIIGMKMDGLRRFKRTLVNGSKIEYEMKNIERAALYRPVVILCKFFCKPSIFAFPMFVLSKKARR